MNFLISELRYYFFRNIPNTQLKQSRARNLTRQNSRHSFFDLFVFRFSLYFGKKRILGSLLFIRTFCIFSLRDAYGCIVMFFFPYFSIFSFHICSIFYTNAFTCVASSTFENYIRDRRARNHHQRWKPEADWAAVVLILKSANLRATNSTPHTRELNFTRKCGAFALISLPTLKLLY